MPRLSLRVILSPAGLATVLYASAPSTAESQSTNVLYYDVPEMRDVQIDSNLVYKRTVVNGMANVPLTLDIYSRRLSNALPAAPMLLLVHGGLVEGTPPTAKDWASFRSWGRAVAASGMTAVVMNHRMNTTDNANEAGDDLLDAMRFLRLNARRFQVDSTRVCVAFFSAGGPIASVLFREQVQGVRCVILYYPFLDMEHLRHATAFRPEQPVERVQAMAAYSPRLWLYRGQALPPIFLARAGRDQIPRLNQSISRFLSVAVESNVSVDFVNHPSGEHGFDTRNRDSRTRDIIVQTLRFAQRHLGLAEQ